MATQRWAVVCSWIALAGIALPAHAQPSRHEVDFGDAGGAAVKGLATIHPLLAVGATQDVQTAVESASPIAYGGNLNGVPNAVNACIGSTWSAAGFFAVGSPPSFSSNSRIHDYVFTFAPGITVSELTLRLADWGDNLPFGACPDNTCGAGIVAYDASDLELDRDELTFTSASAVISGRPTDEFGSLATAGDACQATAGQPGNVTFTVAAAGIAKVAFAFHNKPSEDPLVGFNGLAFEVEQPLVVVAAAPGLATSEAGATASFTVALAWQPAAPVEIEVASGDATEGRLSTGGAQQPSLTLTFTAADWDSPQTVTVHGQDDLLADGDVGYTVAVNVAASSQVSPLEDFDPSDIALINNDDETSPEDIDGDGVPNTVEQTGPNGGDGDGDGNPDFEQPGVATLPAASGGGQLTVIASCDLREVAAVPLASLPSQSFLFPWGLVEFRLPCASADLDVLFHGAPPWSPAVAYRKYGPVTPGAIATAAWYTLPAVTFDTVLVAGAAVPRASFALADGVLGDDTAADGWIVDQGGPGVPPAVIPTLSGWLLMAMAVLLGAAGAVALRGPAAR